MASTKTLGLRPVKTCTECRQAKLRCDSKDKFPDPCSRCQARHLFCKVDATFKRTPARRRLEAMSKELEELRSQRDRDRDRDHASAKTDTTPESGPSSTVDEDRQDSFELSAASVVLRDVALERSLAVEAFRTFAEVFRPQLPVIGCLITDQIHRTEPFLFWTIIIIIASHLPDQEWVDILHRLREPYVQFLREQILDSPLPLHKVQALVLLCYWPLPCEMQPRDPSWLYCGTIIQAGRFMGLDRQQNIPSLRSLGVRSSNIQARINSWLGCFYVATSLSLHLGLPPPLDSDLDISSINDFIRRQTLPALFTTQVKVQLVVAKFTALLNHDIGDGATSSFIRLLDTELDPLKSEVPSEGEQTKMIELEILSAKMHLYALVITKTPQPSTSRQIMLRNGLDTSLRIIHLATTAFRSSRTGRDDVYLIRKQRCLPKNHYRSLAFATIFLLKFFHRNPSDFPDEKQTVANHIAMAQDLFKACAVEPLDEYNRTAKVFEALGRDKTRTESSKLRLTHRMGVSIVYDAVASASEVRGKPVEIPEEEDSAVDANQSAEEVSELQEPDAAPYEPFVVDQFNPGDQFFAGFWNDHFMNMFGEDAMALDMEYQDQWQPPM